MRGNPAPYPPLVVHVPAKVLYFVLALALTLVLFGLIPVFDTIDQESRPDLELMEIPIVATPHQEASRKIERPRSRKPPKPKLRVNQKLNALAPLEPEASLEASLALPMNTLRPGLGDVSINFKIVEPRVSTPKPAEKIAFTVRDLDAPPRLLTPVRPIYPLQAKQYGTEGYVDIEFEIETDGTVKTIDVIDAEPPGVFEEATCRAVRRWRFSIPLKDGKAVKVRARKRIEFISEKL